MTTGSTESVERNETRTSSNRPDQEIVGATPWTDVGAPPLYDKVDRRLMDTFPASDAVAQY